MATGLIGRKIGGRYEIRGLLGHGGMAEVYEGYHPKLDRKVAVKLLHRHLSSDPQFQVRFEREAQAIARLKHPHIIQVYDFDRDDELGQYYMVIEYIDGATLSQHMQQHDGKQLPLSEAIRIMEEVTDALGYAHAEQMQHRDIKPSNIMIDRGRTVLTDFGIAKLVREGGTDQLTASGAMIGTPAYISPEQASGLPGDHRSDIYSLGITFYQLTTGRLPYEGDTPIATILKHLQEVPTLPSMLNPTLPPGVEAVILRSIAKDPNDRYQNAGDMLADLRNLSGAASQLDLNRTLSTKTVTPNIFLNNNSTATYTPGSTRPTSFDDSLTDTLATAPRRTSLLIGIGAIAIIALVAMGAILFSTASNNSPDNFKTPNPCMIELQNDLFARPEADATVTADIEFKAGSAIEILNREELSDGSQVFYLVKDRDTEGWIEDNEIEVPANCSPE